MYTYPYNISGPIYSLNISEFTNLCINYPDYIKYRMTHCYTLRWDYMDIVMEHVFSSFDDYQKNIRDDKISADLLEYFYVKGYSIKSLSKNVYLYELTNDNDIMNYFNILNNYSIDNIESLYCDLWHYCVEQSRSVDIIYKIIDIVGIDKVCDSLRYNTAFYKTAIKHNYTLEQIVEIMSNFDIWTHSKFALRIINDIADRYGYEYGLKIILTYDNE